MNSHLVKVLHVLTKHGSPLALTVRSMAMKGDWLGLQRLKVDPRLYRDSESMWKDRLCTDLVRKMALPGSEAAKKAAAIATFWECETQNCATNVRLSRFIHGDCQDPADLALYGFIDRWRKEVSDVLGKLPRDLTPRFSGGATVLDRANKTTLPDKLANTPALYPQTSCLLPLWNSTTWGRYHGEIKLVRANVFFTVPKDGTKDRGCCKEATIPLGYQLALDDFLKKRLLRIGCDLKDGQQRHQWLAKEASEHGLLSTLDMSNASDLLARLLPKLVLPGDWHDLFDSLRATHTVMPRTSRKGVKPGIPVKGGSVRLEKFSSMGNGFTFGLETLIFATLARVIARDMGYDPDTVSCYGDDLIVPRDTASTVLAALRWIGFTPNERKCFVDGPFRESCGGDYFLGAPVSAVTLEVEPVEPHQWISLANTLRSRCEIDIPSPSMRRARWRWVRKAWDICVEQVPSIARCYGPSRLGDSVIHTEEVHWSVAKRKPKGSHPTWDQRWVYAWVPVTKLLPWHHWQRDIQMMCTPLGVSSEGVAYRGNVTGYRRQRIPIIGLPL